MAQLMSSQQFRDIVAPLLTDAFDSIYNQRADEWKQVFKEKEGIPRQTHYEPVLFGMGAAPEVPDGNPISYDAGGELFNAAYVYKVFGLAFAITRVLVEDGDHIRLGRIYAEHLGQSVAETKEQRCANLLNRAFNTAYTFGDGVALCVNNHPGRVGTLSNVLTTAAALSQTSLEQMLIQVRGAVDWNGKKIRLLPKQLVVGPSLGFQAEVILKSVLRTGTANNDINPVKSMGLLPDGVAMLSRISSTTAWWVQTDAPRGLQVLFRRKVDKGSEGDFETDSMRYKATERYIEGATDTAHCIFGTPGA